MWKLIDPAFWFDISAPVRMSAPLEIGMFAFFGLLVIAGAAVRIARRNTEADRYLKHALDRLAGIFLAYGIFGFIWLFLRYEEIPFFGSRFWMLLWAVGVIISGYKLWKYWYKEVPETRMKSASKGEQNKYLPRRSR